MSQDRSTGDGSYHRPVMAQEVADLLAPVMPGVVVDATFGGGGHSRRLLEEFGAGVEVIGIDRDADALANAAKLRVTAVEGNFSHVRSLVRGVTSKEISGVLFDFGVSSHQLDQPERGFSYHHEGPLDMRMGADTDLTAGQVVNEWSEQRLTQIIRRYGEEPLAPRIARALVKGRPFDSTSQVATAIAAALPAARRRAGHPARRTFQAIRMAVNAELEAIESGLDQAIEMVRPAGRVVAISYHSLEDRTVKQRFLEGARGCTCPPDLPVCGCDNTAELRILTRRPLRPSAGEIAENYRSRSAVLRAVEKVTA